MSQQLQKVTGWSLQLHGQGHGVKRLNAHLVRIVYLTLVECSGSLEVIQQTGHGRAGGRRQRPLPAKFKILSCDRLAITPTEIVAQMK